MSNRSRSERYSRVPGPFRVRVTARRTVDGQTFYTAVNTRTAEVYPWCALLSGSGGTEAVFVHAPIGIPEGEELSPFDAPEALLTFDSKGAAYISGISPAAQPADLVELAPEVEDNEAHPGTFTPRDYVIANGKARIIVDADGNVLVKACRSLRLQVGDEEDNEAGRVAVFSVDGEALSDVVLYDPLRSYLVDTIKARVDEVSQVVEAICTSMATAGTAPTAGFKNPFLGVGAPSLQHVPLAEPTADLATPYLSASRRAGTGSKEAWDD